MAIHYELYPNSGILAGTSYHPRPVAGQTVGPDELYERIATRTTLTAADMKAALSALAESIAGALGAGHRVHVEGLGYFSVSLGGDVQQDPAGHLQLHNACVRSVLFHPERTFLNRFRNVRLTRSRSGNHSSEDASDQDLMATARQLAASGSPFTAKQFRRACGLTPATAYRALRRLTENGLLRRSTIGNVALYVPVADERAGSPNLL